MIPMDWKRFVNNLSSALYIASSAQDPDSTNADVALSAIFSRRFSSPDTLFRKPNYYLFLHADEYPNLRNRTEIKISSTYPLTAYLSLPDETKGLVLTVHGIGSSSDDYNACLADAFFRRGYAVMALDLSCSGRSGGDSLPGLHQSAKDVAAAVGYIGNDPYLSTLPLFLIGHSWGAYGVSAALNYPWVNPYGVCAMSGFSDPESMMVASASAKIKIPLSFRNVELHEAMTKRGGDEAFLSGKEGIERKPNVKVLLIHGAKDRVIPASASLYEACQNEPKSQVECLLLPDKGHADVFLSSSAIAAYQREQAKVKRVLDRHKGKANAVPPKEWDEMIASLDRASTSHVDEKLMDEVDQFFQRALKS